MQARCIFNVTKHLFPSLSARFLRFFRYSRRVSTYSICPSTEPTVYWTNGCGKKQCSPRVTVNQSLDRAIFLFVKTVKGYLWMVFQVTTVRRKKLASNRIIKRILRAEGQRTPCKQRCDGLSSSQAPMSNEHLLPLCSMDIRTFQSIRERMWGVIRMFMGAVSRPFETSAMKCDLVLM